MYYLMYARILVVLSVKKKYDIFADKLFVNNDVITHTSQYENCFYVVPIQHIQHLVVYDIEQIVFFVYFYFNIPYVITF